ncbi:MAG: hypothetical protein JXA10_13090 [Anaerolineae bacterium]|nr:hypothetical protein [Anaerolineae bacterium]
MQRIKNRLDTATWDILVNTVSMIGTIGVTSGLGFVYWWVASQLFDQDEVGFASSAISAMMLIGSIGLMGMGTVFVSQLPQHPEQAGALIFTAVTVAAIISGVFGFLFALAAPYLSADLSDLSGTPTSILIFAVGVSAAGVGIVLDQALIGLLRGGLQLRRNVILGIVKLIILVGFGWVTISWLHMPIYSSWMLGILISLVMTALAFWRQHLVEPPFRFNLHLLDGLGQSALTHHIINLMFEAPARTLPVLVTILISTEATASFYFAWLIVALVFASADALTFVLYAVGVKDESILAQKMRMTLSLSFTAGAVGSLGLLILAHPLLSIFGGTYASDAAWCLRILGLGVFGIIIKDHYTAIKRIYHQTTEAAIALTLATGLELGLASVGMLLNGLTGLALGWLAAVVIEALFMGPTVYRVLVPRVSVPARAQAGD